MLKQVGNTGYRIRDDQHHKRRLVVHFNRLKPYISPPDIYMFDSSGENKDSSLSAPKVEASARNDITNLKRNENVDDRLSESSDETDSDNNLSDMQLSPEQPPALRRSTRVQKAPDHYGVSVGYPDCYTSSSDSD